MAGVCCPHCGEWIDTFPDPGGGEEQEYIEDCSVCCRAIVFRAALDGATGEFVVEADGDV
jgi:Cysteine-rich CPXCG